MNPNEILRRFPRASAAFIKANCDSHTQHAAPKLERHPSHASLETKEIQSTSTARVLVRIIATRKRLIDEDNMCEKFIVDCLRYCGAIPDDSPQNVSIITTQEKGNQEKVTITITALP